MFTSEEILRYYYRAVKEQNDHGNNKKVDNRNLIQRASYVVLPHPSGLAVQSLP